MSVNKVILLGHTGKDPEVKDVAGTKVANLSLATTEKGYTLQNGTQVPDRTEWHSLVFWKGLAEVVERWTKKVSFLCIECKSDIILHDRCVFCFKVKFCLMY